MFAGRRGDILWKKPNFAGVGGRRDFDTYLAVGLVGPFWLRQPLHTFHWGRTLYDAEAIPLRPEPDLRFRAYVADWSGLLLFVTLLAGPVLLAAGFVQRLEERPIWILLVLLGVLALAGLVACSIIQYRLRRADRRDQAIRLLLGPHAWGSSDPAYWHPDLLTYRIDPGAAFGVPSFGELARRSLNEGQWSRSMWAARLCVAVEDAALGEELTTATLQAEGVREKIASVRKKPETRDAAFGPPIPLSTWIQGDLAAKVFPVRARD
jgi:hypothetical protein